MNCFCGRKIRKDNGIGTCREHRYQSEVRKAYDKSYVAKNRDKISEYKKDYARKNLDKTRLYNKKKRSEDINFKLASNLRSRLNRAIKRGTKAGSAVGDLGCSIEEFKAYIESQFQPGMTWQNWGKFGWHIDHICPLNTLDLTNKEQFKKASHYTNLRPMWWQDNLMRTKNGIEPSQECPATKKMVENIC